MTSYSKAVTRCVELLSKRHGYVVVCIVGSAGRYPKGHMFAQYANHDLVGCTLQVTHQTRRPDFDAQVETLFNASLITSSLRRETNGCRYFRCQLVRPSGVASQWNRTANYDLVDPDIPF